VKIATRYFVRCCYFYDHNNIIKIYVTTTHYRDDTRIIATCLVRVRDVPYSIYYNIIIVQCHTHYAVPIQFNILPYLFAWIASCQRTHRTEGSIQIEYRHVAAGLRLSSHYYDILIYLFYLFFEMIMGPTEHVRVGAHNV